MKTFEYVCTTFAMAGILFVFTMWEADRYGSLLAPAHTQMFCPNLVIKHSVKSNLTTGVEVRDACNSALNVIKY